MKDNLKKMFVKAGGTREWFITPVKSFEQLSLQIYSG